MSASTPVSGLVHSAPPPPLVHGMSEAPAGRHVFVVCNGESCRHAGSNRLLGLLRRQCTHGHESQDVRISSSKCLGRCGLAPAMVEDGRVLGWVSLHRLKSELTRLGLLHAAS